MTAIRIIEAEFKTDLVPSPVEYAVLTPAGYYDGQESYPLLYFLHGGASTGPRVLQNQLPLIQQLWDDGRFPPMVMASPSVGSSFYLDYRDGTQKWEQLLVGPFLSFLRSEYRLQEGVLVTGTSMGGAGALRLAFKYPTLFRGVAGMEPGIEASLAFDKIEFEDNFWRSAQHYKTLYGDPVDEDYWALNHPANIVLANTAKIRSSNLAIYLECGDEDSFRLDRGTDMLHRILRDNSIPHEYHLVRGADHLGRSLAPRTMEALSFLGRVIKPPAPDPIVENLREMVGRIRENAEKYSPTDARTMAMRQALIDNVRGRGERQAAQTDA